MGVSTHSRPKAAGKFIRRSRFFNGFNTQPPEGGCFYGHLTVVPFRLFQHTAARRRLKSSCRLMRRWRFQHTAARRRLLLWGMLEFHFKRVSTHSRPKAAGNRYYLKSPKGRFQHTAARRRLPNQGIGRVCRKRFNTQPPEGGCAEKWDVKRYERFQHTAARRRLYIALPQTCRQTVSTHSRPKAAGLYGFFQIFPKGFNTQPPEGGCASVPPAIFSTFGFNTQPPEGGCRAVFLDQVCRQCFNTQPPEGGCGRRFRLGNALPVSTHSRPKAAG